MRRTLTRFCLLAALFPGPAHAGGRDAAREGSPYRVDALGRVVEVRGRKAVACPRQTDRTAVLLIAGQSNSANSGGARFESRHPGRVVNFHAGACYPAASPLLGTNGVGGESWTPLADRLVEAGLFDRVVLIPAGIGGTAIVRWRDGGDLNRMLLDVVAQAQGRYRITHMLWHQGESDLMDGTSSADYAARFGSLVASLRRAGLFAPIFVSVASKCRRSDDWDADDAVTRAQRGLVDPARGIHAGPDTNALVRPFDRHDGCHFGASGQAKFADAWVRILRDHGGTGE